MRPYPDVFALLPIAALSACLVEAPPPDPADTPRDTPVLRTTAAASKIGSALDRHPALGAPDDDPLGGCRELPIDNTVAWSCGPDRVLLVQHEGSIPHRSDQEFSAFDGGKPEVVEVDIRVGARSLTGRGIINPRLDQGPRMFTLLVEDPDARRVASCASQLDEADPEDRIRAWCARAVAAALQDPSR